MDTNHSRTNTPMVCGESVIAGGRRMIKIVIHDEEDIDTLMELAARLVNSRVIE